MELSRRCQLEKAAFYRPEAVTSCNCRSLDGKRANMLFFIYRIIKPRGL